MRVCVVYSYNLLIYLYRMSECVCEKIYCGCYWLTKYSRCVTFRWCHTKIITEVSEVEELPSKNDAIDALLRDRPFSRMKNTEWISDSSF